MKITREEKLKLLVDRITSYEYHNSGSGGGPTHGMGGPGYGIGTAVVAGPRKVVDPQKIAEILLDFMEKTENTK